jgi:taurine transport system substrate-binding protein
MKMFRSVVIGIGAAIASMSQMASALDEITVAYFLEWPMPFEYAKVKGTYDEELGVKVNWVSFDTGTAMSAAMASGDVHMAVSQGAPPFVVATSAGQDLQIVDIAISYADNDNCVVAERHEIDKMSVMEIEGKKVGIPIGTAAHFGFLRQMAHFGVDVSTMDVVDMAPAEGAAAFAQGELDMVCGWGGGLQRMLEHGNVLLTGAEKEELGILVFDVTSTPASFVAENPDLVSKFLKVTADANAQWASGGPADMLQVIAKDAGMAEDATDAFLKTASFPTIEEQLSGKWLGGAVQEFLLGVAQVFFDAGGVESILSTYDNAVNSGPLAAAASM